MTTKAQTGPSQGAREIAEKLGVDLCAQDEVAALIDEELRELLPYLAHKPNCADLFGKLCTCGLAALLEKWEPKQEKS